MATKGGGDRTTWPPGPGVQGARSSTFSLRTREWAEISSEGRALFFSPPRTCPLAVVLAFDLESTCFGQCPLGSVSWQVWVLHLSAFSLGCLPLSHKAPVWPDPGPRRMGGTWRRVTPDQGVSWSTPEVAACPQAAQPSPKCLRW